MNTNEMKPAAMDIKILGTGCSKCKTLEQRVRDVVMEEKLFAEVSKIEDIVEIMKYGVMSTPGLVVNEKVVMSGSLPSKSEINKLLNQ